MTIQVRLWGTCCITNTYSLTLCTCVCVFIRRYFHYGHINFANSSMMAIVYYALLYLLTPTALKIKHTVQTLGLITIPKSIAACTDVSVGINLSRSCRPTHREGSRSEVPQQ